MCGARFACRRRRWRRGTPLAHNNWSSAVDANTNTCHIGHTHTRTHAAPEHARFYAQATSVATRVCRRARLCVSRGAVCDDGLVYGESRARTRNACSRHTLTQTRDAKRRGRVSVDTPARAGGWNIMMGCLCCVEETGKKMRAHITSTQFRKSSGHITTIVKILVTQRCKKSVRIITI